ncbi:MAG: iron-containing alcohol dehydrogenase [Maledivibacter sp.]|nr:iron-containing alcohol dehydrogenase [Maledivibacter sp.]
MMGNTVLFIFQHFCKYNLISNPQKFADIVEFMGENITGLSAADKAIESLFNLFKDIGIPAKLSEKGIKEEYFEYMTEMALKDGNAFSNPRTGNNQDIINIFRAAF